MRKKKIKKLTACLLALALTLTATSCGNSEEQEADAGTAETNASENIGSEKAIDANLEVPKTDTSAEPAEKKQIPDFELVELWSVYAENDKTELTLIFSHHLDEVKSVTFSCQDVLLDGVSAGSWETYGFSAENYMTEPDLYFSQALILDTNIYDYSELTMQLTAEFDDGTKPYPFSATCQISEIEKREKVDPSGPSVTPVIVMAEQELYNANGIVITLPEQKLDPNEEPKIHFESSNGAMMYLSFMNLTVDGELIREGAHNTSDSAVSAGDSFDDTLPVGESLLAAVDSGRESGEISFVLFFTENQHDTFDEAAVTIPYTIIEE